MTWLFCCTLSAQYPCYAGHGQPAYFTDVDENYRQRHSKVHGNSRSEVVSSIPPGKKDAGHNSTFLDTWYTNDYC